MSKASSAIDDGEFTEVRPSQLKEILLDLAQEGEPVGILGDPGIGKSEIVTQVALEVGKPMFAPCNLALSDGSDIKGMPDLSQGFVKWVKEQNWLMRVENATTVFLDEYPQSQIITMCAAAPIILEKRVDDIYLHPDTWVVWAGNHPKNKAGTNRLPSHIPNRSVMLAVCYSAEDHIAYEIERDDTDTLTLRFLRMKGDVAYDFDPARLINPTPRAWSWVARKLYRNPNTPMATIAGRIPKGLASELMAFRNLAPMLPSREEVLMKPKEAKVPDNTSAQFLITDMLADAAGVNNFDALVEYAKRLPAEMQAKFVKDSMKRKPEVASTKAFVAWGVKFAEVLR